MLILSFFYAAVLLALGFVGLQSGAGPDEARALGLPGLYFGGAVFLCAFFALKEPRHGLAGASFLAFLAVLTNLATIGGPLLRGGYRWHLSQHRLATLVAVVSLIYLACALRWWRRRRRAQALAELRGE